jgi:hypothetical protein
MAHAKLHIPGPVEVSETTLQALRSPMIGHRGQGFKDLYAKIQPQLQTLVATRQLVYLSTSSAWGVMEGAIRNLVAKKVLNCMCGAFSDKWLDVSRRCGKEADGLQVPWGSPVRAEEVDKRLATGQFDALTLIHNETSTVAFASSRDWHREKLRRVIGMFREDQFFQRRQMAPAGLEHDQHLAAALQPALPPVMGFQTRNKVRARHQARAQRGTGKRAGDPKIGGRNQHNGKAAGRFHGEQGTHSTCATQGRNRRSQARHWRARLQYWVPIR